MQLFAQVKDTEGSSDIKQGAIQERVLFIEEWGWKELRGEPPSLVFQMRKFRAVRGPTRVSHPVSTLPLFINLTFG